MNKQKKKNTKYIFSLKNIDIEKVNLKYGIILISNINSDNCILPNTTKISELSNERVIPEIISFLDESKKNHQCNISMIDFNTNTDSSFLRYNCYWDRHPFQTKPIGCPIKYISSQAIKSYYSEISKDVYTIKENIPSSKRSIINDKRINIKIKEYYETDGIFCSFPCCCAYIRAHKHLKDYEQSEMLLLKMYNEMMGTKTEIIDPAPHWRLLKEYGGNKTISEFRATFNKVDHDFHGTIKYNMPLFRPIGHLFEEKIKF
jgi:hypothetical protein